MELTPKQQMFVAEYLVDLNATQAAIRAGYSKHTAKSVGHENLTKPYIAEAVQLAQAERAQRVEVSQDVVLKELLKLALSDVRGLFDDNGRLLPVHMLPDNIAAAVSSVEVVTSRIPGSDPVEVEHTSKIKFWDKRGSLELLGRHLKLFTDKVEFPDKNGNPQMIGNNNNLLLMTTKELEDELERYERIAESTQG